MTVTTHDPAAPRSPGSCYGGHGGHDGLAKGARCYGQDGDLCRHPGCTARLSAYNSLDRCACHSVGGRKRPQRRRGTGSACGEATSTAAPEPRRVTTREVDMAAKKRQEARVAKEAVRRYAEATAGWFTSAQVGSAVDAGNSTVRTYLHELVTMGLLESSSRKGYRLRQAAPMACYDDVQYPENVPAAPIACGSDCRFWFELDETCVRKSGFACPPMTRCHFLEDAPEVAPSGAAPVPMPEQPADPPAAPHPSLREPPAAGIGEDMCAGISEMASMTAPAAITVDWFTPTVEPSEATVIGYLEDMEDEARARVLVYCLARWPA